MMEILENDVDVPNSSDISEESQTRNNLTIEEAEGWETGAFEIEYSAFDPTLLTKNDRLFNELLLAGHIFTVSKKDYANDCIANEPTKMPPSGFVENGNSPSFVEMAADTFGLNRPCLVCSVLDAYRREYGMTPQWMADYAFLCSKCLAAPPCATVTFVTAFEFVYIMDKHYLKRQGATLVSAFGRRVLTHEDIQRHFFVHACFRTDGGVPGRRQNDLVIAKNRGPGRPAGGRHGPTTLGLAKVLYSKYSYLAQSSIRAMMCTIKDSCVNLGEPNIGQLHGNGNNVNLDEPDEGAPTTITNTRKTVNRPRNTCTDNVIKRRRDSEDSNSLDVLSKSNILVPESVGCLPSRSCPQHLAVALTGWKECAKGVECEPPPGRRNDCCISRALKDYDDYEAAAPMLNGDLHDNDQSANDINARRDRIAEFENSKSYGDLTLLILAGTGAVPINENTVLWNGKSDERIANIISMAAKIRAETVETFWEERRQEFGLGTVSKFTRFYENDVKPDLTLGPVSLTHLKYADVKGGTSAECVLCNLMIVKEYWLALRRLKRDMLTYSSNNISLFHSVRPTIDEWEECNKLGLDDGGCFIALIKGAGIEAIYKHMFCDPMCTARVVQTDPSVLFGHPSRQNVEELVIHKARLANANRFEGRVCAGFWAMAFTFKMYQVFPPRPTALANFVKDAGSMLLRHSISLISLEHTLTEYL